MAELKRPLNYDEQIQNLIKNHNLIISCEKNAKTILSLVNYYRLSAYGIGLTKKGDKEVFCDGITIENIYNLYLFDCKFKTLLISLIEEIEIQLRTKISYHLSLKYGAEGYMDKNNFVKKINKDGLEIHNIIIDHFTEERKRQINLPFVKHHENKYGGHYPLWVATELFTFGTLSSLYSIMKPEDKKEIAKQYNVSEGVLQSWILSLIEVRNICAHYGRIYNMPLKQRPYMFKEYKKYNQNKITKIFPVLLVIKNLLNGDDLWKDFVKQLEKIIKEYNEVKISFMGFPKDWKDVLSK